MNYINFIIKMRITVTWFLLIPLCQKKKRFLCVPIDNLHALFLHDDDGWKNALKGERRKIKLELDKGDMNGSKQKERKQKSQKRTKKEKIPLHCFTLHSLVWEMPCNIMQFFFGRLKKKQCQKSFFLNSSSSIVHSLRTLACSFQ